MNVVDIDQNNAQQYLIDESFNRPVVVDFWADSPTQQMDCLTLIQRGSLKLKA